MNQPPYQAKLADYNEQVQQLRAEVSRAQSKVISRAQNKQGKSSQVDPYTTPTKPNPKPQPANSLNAYSHNTAASTVTAASTSTSTKSKQEQLRDREKEKKEQEEERRDFEDFLTFSHRLRDVLEEKAKFIEIQYEKEKIYWGNERDRYEKTIQELNSKIELKDLKIQEMLEKIAELKQHLKAALEKCEEQAKIIVDLRGQNSALKQENIAIKLENKNVKADNKVVIAHLDKLINEKQKDQEKTAKEIFELREKRVIESLYFKSFSISTEPRSEPRPDLLPSERNELSNKVKLEKTLEEYMNHREESNRMIKHLEDTVRVKQNEIEAQKRRIAMLEDSFRKVTELRDIERDSSKKQSHIIQEYEKQFVQLRRHNECLSEEIEKYYKLPRFKEKIGCISRVKKIKDSEV